MNTTELINPPRPPGAAHHRSARPSAPPSELEPATAGALLGEVLPLISLVPTVGPPMVFIAVPWVLLTLMLIGPFLLLVTFAFAGLILFAVTAAILAPPYLLARHLRTRWTRHPGHRPFAGRRLRRLSRLGLRHGVCTTRRPAAEPLTAADLPKRRPTHLRSEGS